MIYLLEYSVYNDSFFKEYDVPLVANSDKTRESEEIAQPEEVILTSDRHSKSLSLALYYYQGVIYEFFFV